jgi:hypothetical protein
MMPNDHAIYNCSTRACLMAHEGSQIIREAMTTIAR